MVKPTRSARLKKIVTKNVNLAVQAKRVKRKRNKKVVARKVDVFGPVATIDTAPVSVGNTYQGCKPVVTHFSDGIRVQGRDFLMNVDPTAITITDWCLVGACPVSPDCMVASAIKGFVNTYAEYSVHGVAFHYITAAATTNQGSMMMYIGKNRQDPGLDVTNDNFMSVVLSDDRTVLGPVWKNSTATYFPPPVFRPTNIMSTEGLHEQAPGELFVYTKITDNVTPGFILVDYDISFRGLQANPRGLTLPIARMKYHQVALHTSTTTINTAIPFLLDVDKLLDGVTTSAPPSGYTIGDVYKVVMNSEYAALGGRLRTGIFSADLPLTATASINVDDGYTCYGLAIAATTMVMYSTYYAACSAASPLVAAVSNGNVLTIPAYVS